MNRTQVFVAPLVLLCGLDCAPLAHADPGYYLVSVYENEGEANIDFRYWTVNNHGSGEVIWPEIGFGYGVTKRWYTELYASWIGSGTMATRLSSLNWQNDYLLTQGQYDVDIALHTNLIHNYDTGRGASGALEWGPTLQTELGRWRVNANLIFESSLGAGRHSPTELKYQWQFKYRWRPEFQFGVFGFGELGEWDDWDSRGRQSHRAGPMFSGTWSLGQKQEVRYQAGMLFGSTYRTQGRMFTMRLQYVY